MGPLVATTKRKNSHKQKFMKIPNFISVSLPSVEKIIGYKQTVFCAKLNDTKFSSQPGEGLPGMGTGGGFLDV